MDSAASNLPFNYISTRHKSEFLKGDAGMVLAREKTQYEAIFFWPACNTLWVERMRKKLTERTCRLEGKSPYQSAMRLALLLT
jgi:hypothetical protein